MFLKCPAPEKGSGSLFQITHEAKLVLLSIVLIAMSSFSLWGIAILNVGSFHSVVTLEIWAFKLVFSGVNITVGVIALLVGIVDSRIVSS